MTERVPLSTAVVAVDGPSGSGKSSVARGAARRLGLAYLDTGALYRAVTLWMLQQGIDVHDADAVTAQADRPRPVPGHDPMRPSIELDGTDVSRAIREPRVTEAVSAVSAVPAVRAKLLAIQRAAIDGGGIVVEGRDIGTVVCPEATVKVFLTASPEARAARRSRQLTRAGHGTQHESTTQADLEKRDAVDSGRAVSPLAQADDAVVIDSTSMTLDETVEVVVALVRERTEKVSE